MVNIIVEKRLEKIEKLNSINFKKNDIIKTEILKKNMYNKKLLYFKRGFSIRIRYLKRSRYEN